MLENMGFQDGFNEIPWNRPRTLITTWCNALWDVIWTYTSYVDILYSLYETTILLSFGYVAGTGTSACLLTSALEREKKNLANTAELSDHMKWWILGLSIQPLSAELCKSIQTDTKSKHTPRATIGNWSGASLFKICRYIFVLWITILKWNLNSYLK